MNESIRLILVRHGNTFEAGETPRQIGARSDLPLTAQGRAQAIAMRSYLTDRGIVPSVIYTGSLQRQKEFAAILCAQCNGKIPCMIASAFTEIDYGPWEGLTAEELGQRWPKEYAAWVQRGIWAQGIFPEDLAMRLSCIDALLSSLPRLYPPNSTVVAITSNGVLKIFPVKEKGKVRTGNFCELHLSYPEAIAGEKYSVSVQSWDVCPVVVSV